MTTQNFSNFELDQLKEILNIGASHASTALSQLIGKRVLITIPEALADSPAKNVSSITGLMDEKEIATAVILKILGDVPGVMSFFMLKDSAHTLAHLVLKTEGNTKEFLSEYEESALKEVGNIICGAALSAFSKFLDITMLQSISEVATDMFSSIVSTVMVEAGKESELALVFKVTFKIEGEDINAQLCLFTDEYASAQMLSILKNKLNM